MSALPKRRLTANDYLAIERAAASKSEFYQGEITPTERKDRNQLRIKENLLA